MADQLVLTFAEVEFVLRARSGQADQVRMHLRINPEASTDIVVAAGVASLLARRLCEAGEPDLVGEAEGPGRAAPRQADQPVAAAFFCA